jgi:TATA-binding protein-associated factor Taf7
MYKLDSEGFINSWSEVKGFDLDSYQKGLRGDLIVSDDEDCDDDNDEDYVENEGGGDDDCDYEDEDDEDKDDYEQQVSTLSDRVWSLETSVSQIGSTVSKIFDMLTLFKLDRLNQLKKNSESLNME